MPSPRRKRFLLLAIILSVLVILYITTGAKSTESSPFYQKTMALMDSKKAQGVGSEPLSERKIQDGGAGQNEQQDQAEATDKLKERLKEAEVAAKKSADDKWKIAADKADVVADPGEAAKKVAGKPIQKIKEEVAARAQQIVANAGRAAAKAAGIVAEKPIANVKEAAAKAQEVVKDAVGDNSNDRAGFTGRRKYPASADQAASEDGVAHVGPQVDSSKPVAIDPEEDAGAAAAAAAKEEFTRIMKRSPMVIFSKSYCPYSKKAKRILLSAFTITPTPFVVELDQHDLGHELQDLLLEKTGRRTVPNVLVAGQSIGGGDDVEDLWEGGKMEETLKRVGGKLIKSVVENKEIDEESR